MKLSHFFTTVRLVLAPVFFVLYFLPEYYASFNIISAYILIPLFIFMEFTDFLDGFFARKNKQVSDFGKLFDPFADVMANLTVLLVFTLANYLPSIFFLLILYREMSMMFIRMLASRQGITIAARKSGKLKTVLYIIAAGFSLLLESCSRIDINVSFLEMYGKTINYGLYIIALLVSLLSFADYLIHFIPQIVKDQN
ncbi:CDP-diacylglycerol--glycerol-3-phosphate 3-phosphatidyltransferase [Brucepastera parasyntrophica]|uniref:CDP-diacylglycerol--glycerol-3-phosphate 3-phosphatidyltransferase n=1 Tax=Brucepastera parasyntrophica TaxID=2880008 RepID=UPI00210868E5|nr:CDP-diacylglycerol--glycerol-3-phosphate 3-phosphatidyltransferase [Brucepastera parasyntrophica]ULQ59360.1 CDP-diacylglycerol--glycerol-3-phosphate 3-phosphatidyltransferase [Brucepastera parasyntrophica]